MVETIQMALSLYLELLEDTSPFLKKMELKYFSQPFLKVNLYE